MKKTTIFVSLTVLTLFLLSCEEDVEPPHIQGRIQVSTGGDFKFDGDLAKKGTDYFGYCEKDGDNFKFEIGHNDSAHVSGASEIYVYVNGVKGPPQEGVFDGTGKPKKDQSYYTTFSSVRIINTNTFTVKNSEWSDKCDVELWATPIDGELTPETKNKFKHYVRINCSGISAESSNSKDAILSSFNIEMYFSHC